MSLSFSGNGTSSSVSLSILGDGDSTTLTVALENAPLNLEIKSNLPVEVFGFSFGNVGSGSVVLGADRRSVVIMYSSPLQNGQVGSVTFGLNYLGE